MNKPLTQTLSLGKLPGTDVAGETLVELGKSNPDLWVLTADVMHSTKTEPFALAYPDRFVNTGIAEQSLVGVAAGLATCGKIPVAAAFAAMLTMRACEMIRSDVAYPNLNVKLIATHSGFALGAGGTTHHATEDIAIMRALANMTVLVPCDEQQTRAAVIAAIEHNGPVYIRLGRGRDPIVYPDQPDFEIGRANLLRQGRDLTLIGCGRSVAECLQAAELLAEEGLDARVIDMHTVKPLDRAAVASAARQTRMLFSVEEHSTIGGLGSAVAEALSELGQTPPLQRIGLPDIYASIGPQTDLLDKYGLVGPKLAARVLETMRDRGLV